MCPERSTCLDWWTTGRIIDAWRSGDTVILITLHYKRFELSVTGVTWGCLNYFQITCIQFCNGHIKNKRYCAQGMPSLSLRQQRATAIRRWPRTGRSAVFVISNFLGNFCRCPAVRLFRLEYPPLFDDGVITTGTWPYLISFLYSMGLHSLLAVTANDVNYSRESSPKDDYFGSRPWRFILFIYVKKSHVIKWSWMFDWYAGYSSYSHSSIEVGLEVNRHWPGQLTSLLIVLLRPGDTLGCSCIVRTRNVHKNDRQLGRVNGGGSGVGTRLSFFRTIACWCVLVRRNWWPISCSPSYTDHLQCFYRS